MLWISRPKIIIGLLISCLLIPAIVLADLRYYWTTDAQNQIVYCQYDGSVVSSGQIKSSIFIAHSQTLTRQKNKLKKLKQAGQKGTPLFISTKRKIKTLSERQIAEDALCLSALEPDPTPTPTPEPTPEPSPSPTPNPGTGSFDIDGNTTAFGIPMGYVGNISRGRTLQSVRCVGCHEERTGYLYSEVEDALATVPDMDGIDITTQEVVDLIAFFNRFKP